MGGGDAAALTLHEGQHERSEVTNLLREGLTALAGLVIAALVAALALPPFIDWSSLKPRIAERLGALTAMPARIEGPVRITLLPRLRLSTEGVALGEAGQGVHARIARLDMAIPLTSLMRGEIRLGALTLDAVDLHLAPGPDLGLALPPRAGGTDVAIEAATITRGRIILARPATGDDPGTRILPFALTVSTPSLAGPWRIEGEAAGEPFRLVTGVAEGRGDTPVKLLSDNGRRRIDIDGLLGADRRGAMARPRWAGQAQLMLREEAAAEPLASFSLRGKLADGLLTAETISVDLGAHGRLEGVLDWRLADDEARLTLATRRFVMDGLEETARRLAQMMAEGWPTQLRPGATQIALSADQAMWRGEEFQGARASARIDREGVSNGAAEAMLAGLAMTLDTVSLTPAGEARGRVHAAAGALQRPALAAARLGLSPPAADALSSLGSLDLGFAFAASLREPGRLAVTDLRLETARGRASGSIAVTPEAAVVTARIAGIDLSRLDEVAALMPPLGQGRMLSLDLSAEGVRFGAGPAGEARLKAAHGPSGWRVEDIAASGFGGLKLERASQGGGAALSAPDATPVLALAALGWPQPLREGLMQRAGQLSPLALDIRFEPGSLAALKAEGRLGQGYQAALAGIIRGDGFRLSQADITGGGAQLIRLASPAAHALAGLRSALLPEQARLSLRLDGSGGLDVSLRGEGLDARWRAAPGGDGELAGPLSVALEGAEPVRLSATLASGPQATRLGGLDARLAGQRLTGKLEIARDGALAGTLAAEELSLSALAALGLGAMPPAGAEGGWSPARFGNPPALPRLDVSVAAARLALGSAGTVTDVTARLSLDDSSLRIRDVSGRLLGAALAGSLRLGHEGSLRSLGWQLSLSGLEAAQFGAGAVTGRMDIRLEGGGSGETPQRLVNTLSGSGEMRLAGGGLARLSPDAMAHLLGGAAPLGLDSDIAARLGALLDVGAWPLGDIAAPLTLSGGMLRAGPLLSRHGATQARLSGLVDLRQWRMEAVAALSLDGVAQPGEPQPQASVIWRGPLGAPARTVDAGSIRTLIAARELKRELERVEAFEADARERALFARRLRQEREAREREAREAREAEAAREEARRIMGERHGPGPESGPARAPALPPPMQILPVR
jgi:hypothetical protein